MNRLENIFSTGSQILIVRDCAGAPDMQTSEVRLHTLCAGKADIVIACVPFSDPIADSTDEQNAAQEALRNGADLTKILNMLKNIRQNHPDKGLVISGYCNVFLQYGWEALFRELAECGIDGIMVADMPYEECLEIKPYAQTYRVSHIRFISCNSGSRRIQMVANDAQGFLVCADNKADAEQIYQLRNMVNIPVAAAVPGGNALIVSAAGVDTEKLAQWLNLN